MKRQSQLLKARLIRSGTATAAIAAVLLSGTAYGQVAAASDDQGANSGLQDIIVTATRRSDTVNRVPLTISAVTQESLDQQGIKGAGDLQGVVPALTLVSQNAGVGTFAIRGIVATTGAATTGVYLDDTALTKRNNPGVAQQNGAPLPTLFDLERVEVLKGPQGTLYGGSSQGGTIRFITPSPSLTTYSGSGRAELSIIQNGEESNEFGAAIGGPIIQDKLGFRVSGIYRNTGGYIDVYSPYTGKLVREDANSRMEWAVRGALKAQLGERTTATAAWYHSKFTAEGGPGSVTDVYAPNGTINPNQTFTTPTVCYNNSTRPAGATSAPTATACPTGPLPTGWHQRASQTYGPFNYLGKDDSLAPFDGVIPKTGTRNDVGSLTLEHDLGWATFRSITSHTNDRTTGDQGEGHDASRIQSTLENAGKTQFPLFAPLPVYAGRFVTDNGRTGFQQEFRLASSGDASDRFSWVVGAYYSNMRTNIKYKIAGDYDAIMLELYGLTSEQRYSIPNTGGFVSSLDARLRDKELAAFGEANYSLTDKLRVTAGARISRVSLDFTQENFGQLSARPTADSPYGRVAGKRTDSPFTPKVGAQYRFTENDMIYVTAAKGFRAGGVNVPLNPQVCTAGLAQFGLTVDDIPTQYGPDQVWSYEAGAKVRGLDNKLQLNAAVFQIDWTDIQVTTSAQGCGQNWNQNGGRARSRGVDFQADFRPVHFLNINASVGYTDAKYTDPVLGPKPLDPTKSQAITYLKGDPIGVPKWQANIGTRFDFDVASKPSFFRVDYQFQGKYLNGSGYGTGNYNPNTRTVGATHLVNARAGIDLGAMDVNLFVNNVLNSRQKIGNAGIGQSGCNIATGGVGCTVYSFFQPFVAQQYQAPRSIGIQANYRF